MCKDSLMLRCPEGPRWPKKAFPSKMRGLLLCAGSEG
jgi:hypothetical protein